MKKDTRSLRERLLDDFPSRQKVLLRTTGGSESGIFVIGEAGILAKEKYIAEIPNDRVGSISPVFD